MRALVLAAAACTLLAQDQPLVRTSANEVVVDVVVRDKKGKLVRGLTAADFSLSEDGAPQPVTLVREAGLTASTPGATAPAPVAVTVADATRAPRLVTLVFDRLGIDSRRLARQAAFDLVREELPPKTYVAVFFTDLHLKVIQPFTNDRGLVRSAIEKATGNAPTDYANAAVDLRLAKEGSAGAEGSAEAAANSRGQGVDGAGMAAEAMNRMVTDMLDFAENSAREQQGRSSVYGLWGIAKAQQRLPGRKTLLYFSEGLHLPNALQNQFRNMISAANRANVAIYAIDARGLSASGDNALGKEMLDRNMRVSQGTYRTSQTGEQVTREQMMQFDRAMDAIRANPQVALAELAESTGGFLIANTNDFRQPLRRLTEEANGYYEVLYRPANANLDGRFRTIEVKVNQRDVKVQARNGYFALPTLGERHAVFPYEVPLLKALAEKPLPRGVEFRSSVLRFRPAAAGAVQASIVFDMPMKDVTFRQSEDRKSYRTHVAFLALLKNDRGEVIDKISRDLPVDEPAEKLDAFRQGRAIFARQVNLRPGRYTLESAVADRIGERIAARRTAVVVAPRAADAVALSSPVLVRRTSEAPSDAEPDDPYIHAGTKVIPTLIEAIPGGAGKALSLYFVVYAAKSSATKPVVTIEFLKDGDKLGGGSPELPPMLADGRIPYMANTPLDSFRPGLHEIRITAAQDGARDQQSIFVTIE